MRAPWLLALALVACSEANGDRSLPTTPAPTSAAPTTATPTPSPTIAVTTSREDVHFRTPTGNIGCYLGVPDEEYGGGVSCDISQHSWPLPPEPADCEYDWGATLSVGVTRPPEVGACRSDTSLGGPTLLAYGTGVRAGQIECVSETSGVTCRSLTSGHGFFLSRASYRVF